MNKLNSDLSSNGIFKLRAIGNITDCNKLTQSGAYLASVESLINLPSFSATSGRIIIIVFNVGSDSPYTTQMAFSYNGQQFAYRMGTAINWTIK